MSGGPRERPEVSVSRDRCPYCHEEVGVEPARTACSACTAWHHQACWDEHGGCSACGAERAPAERAARVDPKAPAPDSAAGECRHEGCQAPAAEITGFYRRMSGRMCRRHARKIAERNAMMFLAAGFALVSMGVISLLLYGEERTTGPLLSSGLGLLVSGFIARKLVPGDAEE